jgi:hypothetical protein
LPRHRARIDRLLIRALAGSVLIVTLSYVPLSQPATARVAHKGILIEANNAQPGLDKVVDLGMSSDMVGFTWTGPTRATLDVRGFSGSTWGEWVEVDGTPSEAPDAGTTEHAREKPQQVSAGPAWLGYGVSTIEVRVTEGVAHGLTMHALDSRPISSGGGVQPAGADTPLPFIIPRSGWGADETLRCPDASYASRVDFAVVHHTVNSNSYGPNDSAALIRGIYYFHTQVNGWCDIGYNFLIDRFGRVFEGRYGGINKAVIGAHAGGFNAGSTGVSLIGSFDSSPVPGPMYNALRSLLAWKLAYHLVDPMGSTSHTVAESDCNCQRYPVGSTPTFPTITGHSDLDFTGCPGGFAYGLLPQLRADVAMDIGNQGPAQWICQWDKGSDFGPGMVSPAAKRDDVFVRGGDGQLWQKVQTPTSTSSWSPLGGFLTSDPDAASWSAGRIDVFARGADGALWHRGYTGSGWSAWQSLGGQLASSPSAVSWGPNRIDVFGCGMDGALWTRTWNGSVWSPWSSLGGILQAAPEAASDGSGHLDVMARGVNGAMYVKSFRNGAWSAWGSAAGGSTSGAGAVSWGPNRIDLFTRGEDGAMWGVAWTGSGWTGWYSLGGLLASDPDVASPGPNTLVITVKGVDGNYWQRVWDNNTWQPWRVI